jgi:hypothetical protein
MTASHAKVEDFVARKAGNYLFSFGTTAEAEPLDQGWALTKSDIQ